MTGLQTTLFLYILAVGIANLYITGDTRQWTPSIRFYGFLAMNSLSLAATGGLIIIS